MSFQMHSVSQQYLNDLDKPELITRDELPVFNGDSKVPGLKQTRTSCGTNALVTRNLTHSQYLMIFFLIREKKSNEMLIFLKSHIKMLQ